MTNNEMHCPFCGHSKLLSNKWWVDDNEVDALECANCYAGAPLTAWANHHAATPVNTWIDGSVHTAPGQQVVLHYRNHDGSIVGPVVSTPVRADGTTTYNGKPLYKPTIWWLVLPPLPKKPED